ncbi:MAG TPA: deoxyribose-phosphate aldolase [Egibacteraceae bacterium]|nr:deoxyribose-phosphate aldolase [Egibacteraceae bacterium]
MTGPARWSGAAVAGRIEATLLAPQATADEVRALCADAAAREVRGVCVASQYAAVAREAVAGTTLMVVTVAGFPTGASLTAAKVAEIRAAADAGADEVDVVCAFGLVRSGDVAAARADLAASTAAAQESGVACKVILETGWLSAAQVEAVCRWAVDAGARWVKTSTGFGPRGASVEDVTRMRAAVGEAARVKAAGGIRSLDQAVALLDAGADALGCSSPAAVLDT